jgi:nitrate reductase NapE component
MGPAAAGEVFIVNEANTFLELGVLLFKWLKVGEVGSECYALTHDQTCAPQVHAVASSKRRSSRPGVPAIILQVFIFSVVDIYFNCEESKIPKPATQG